jgi:broad specificity phosphatase PhoE
MRFIFVRHGEPDYANDCLTENGKKQAINVAMRLKDEDISAIFSSPMGRARETASYTAKSHNLEIQNLDFTAQNGEMIIPRLELFNDMDHIESYKRETLHFEK